MTGLKICTRCFAISARRRRRMSSSLLPENIGPTTTSIQPMLPLTISTLPPSEIGRASCLPISLFRDFRPAKTANEFLALAGKHWADDDLDPAHVALDDIHASPL